MRRRACNSRRCKRSRSIGEPSTTCAGWSLRLNALPQFTTEIDGLEHPLHSCAVQARERAATAHHPRLAWLGDRDARGDRATDQPNCAWRDRRGCVPSHPAVAARARLFGEADGDWLGSRPHRARLGGVDEPPWLHPLCRSGRRPGRQRHRRDGPPGPERAAGHSPQFAWLLPAGGAGRDLRRQHPRAGGTSSSGWRSPLSPPV